MLPLKIQAAARPKLPGAAACPPQNDLGSSGRLRSSVEAFPGDEIQFFVQCGNSLGSRVIFIKIE